MGKDDGVANEVVIREATKAGFKLVNQSDSDKHGMDYFLVFAGN